MAIVTVKDICADLRERFEAKERLALYFGDARILLNTNSAELAFGLADYFDGFLDQTGGDPDIEITALDGVSYDLGDGFEIKEPDPGKTKIKEEFLDFADGRAVRKRLTGMMFLFGTGCNMAWGPCRENDNQVVNFINNRFIQWGLERGALLAHAAAVSREGRGLALAGFSGMGKSTLALHLMSRGLHFVSNDRLLIRRSGNRVTMLGVPKLPRINPGTALNNPDLESVIPPGEREQFETLASDEIWDLEHKYDVRIDECFGPGRFNLSSSMEALAILNWHRDGAYPELHQVDLNQRRDLLGAVRKSPGLFFLSPDGEPDYSEEAYIRRLEGVAVYEVRGGVDFQAAADLLSDLDCL